MILQVLFYAELETFALKFKFNSKSLAPPLKISGCATVIHSFNFELRKSAVGRFEASEKVLLGSSWNRTFGCYYKLVG